MQKRSYYLNPARIRFSVGAGGAMARSLESLRQLQATKQVRSGNDFNAIEGFYYDCARFAGLGSAARGAAGAAWTVLYLKSKKNEEEDSIVRGGTARQR